MTDDVYRAAFGFVTSQILYASARLGVPEALVGGAAGAEQLAAATGSNPRTLDRLLRALVVLGMVEQVAPGRFALAGPGQPLCTDHPMSIRSGVLLFGAPEVWHAWGALTHSVRTGEPAFDRVHGEPLFDQLAHNPDLSGIFHAAMRTGSEKIASEFPKVYDFTGVATVVDVGGGNGALLAGVLAAAPAPTGILFDSTDGVAGATELFQRAGLTARVSVETGDFFERVPSGEVLMLKSILHDWDDQRCATLLRSCRRAIAADGRLLVLEKVVPTSIEAPDAAAAVMSDIAMLVYTGGQERTEAEFRDLLAAAGFTLTRVAPLPGSPTRVLVAEPAF